MVVSADVVTPTSINQRVMAAQIMADLADEQDHARLMAGAERIVRAYDPCISCAVHLVPVRRLNDLRTSVRVTSRRASLSPDNLHNPVGNMFTDA